MPSSRRMFSGISARGQLHRGVARAEEAGRRRGEVAAFGRRVERDVVGHLAVGPAQLAGEDRAEVGILQARLVRAAAHHQPAPPPWSPFLVFSERMMQVCFIRWAIFGISSEMWTPGTTVWIARNGPPVGRPGLGPRSRAGSPRRPARAGSRASAASSARRPAPGS